MRRLRYWLPLFFVVVSLSVGSTAPLPASPPPALRTAGPGVQPDVFYDPASFFNGLEVLRSRGLPPARPGALVGGLVPHHNLAGEMFSRLFVQFEAAPPKTVIVVGPNHDNRGQRVITGRRGWSTAFGVVEADQALVTKLEAAGLATVDDRSLEPEHAIGALMPYLKYHAPAAKVVPVILHRGVTLREMERLAGFLAPLLSPDTVLVASVDFSHYLTRTRAEANDAVTLKAIQAFDLPALMEMGPDFVDSPPSLGVLMLAMRQIGADGPVVEGNTNSGRLFGSDLAETTSYFTFSYRLPGGGNTR
ncbi:MAG TPA: AmmeMemoRadiSam system protein B [Symbiobacteriaceae bacterium]|nr:AmmeMemoRadiSam system protein B [Symbiobacteriaceae bacterium]